LRGCVFNLNKGGRFLRAGSIDEIYSALSDVAEYVTGDREQHTYMNLLDTNPEIVAAILKS
jgi:hypothetical protein